MRPQDEALRRLAKVEPFYRDGVAWYNARDVCEALGARYAYTYRWIAPEHKRMVCREVRKYTRTRVSYVDADGVAEIVRRRGWLSQSAALAALAK